MRQIKFKGKDYEGKWHDGNREDRITSDGEVVVRIVQIENPWQVWVVDPETVGEYTGKPDLNDNEIYEDDWIEYKECIYLVVYDADEARFMVEDDEGHRFPLGDKDEIVGNKHDNPKTSL